MQISMILLYWQHGSWSLLSNVNTIRFVQSFSVIIRWTKELYAFKYKVGLEEWTGMVYVLQFVCFRTSLHKLCTHVVSLERAFSVSVSKQISP